MKIETENKEYSIEFWDQDTVDITMKWGPDLQYSMSTFKDIDAESQTIIWDKEDDKWISASQRKYFDKIVKYKIFL